MDLSGFDELDKKLAQISKKMPAARDTFLAQEAELARGYVLEETPKDTGQLRMGWKRTRPVNGQVELYNNTEYAAHVNYGHRVKVHGKFTNRIVPGVKMLEKGLETTKTSFLEDARDVLKGLMG